MPAPFPRPSIRRRGGQLAEHLRQQRGSQQRVQALIVDRLTHGVEGCSSSGWQQHPLG
jgi:hypothetical protein